MPPTRRLLVRLIHAWGRLTRSVTLGVRAVVIDEAGNVLLLRHSYVPGWHLPGGAVDPGESAEAAVIRELHEETAVTPLAPPRLHGLMLNRHLAARDHVAVYVVTHFAQGVPRVPNREIVEIGFFPPDALPEDTSPATRRRIEEVLAGAPVAAHW
ncbi:NUDIX domain-containing protein [Starkeya koreensis]|uniref:NUDIX domain-containing protein n=1 Tax=Ancylobacter koreensis TaxID=266121 RepID=A0ABT0DS31_9HYPH|nr:NUDIX domain-containing protein [Ancylobacter koreensis]MCK0210091.1 NUDIX domain-containing protein [Ancylobacter koreensis]